MRLTEADIIEAVRRRFGLVVVSVVHYVDRALVAHEVRRKDSVFRFGDKTRFWVLSIEGEIVGRRETLGELLEFAESYQPTAGAAI